MVHETADGLPLYLYAVKLKIKANVGVKKNQTKTENKIEKHLQFFLTTLSIICFSYLPESPRENMSFVAYSEE